MLSFDPHMPLEAACTYFYLTGKTHWQSTDAQALAKMLQSSNPPEFKSVLGIVGGYDEDKPHDEIPYLGSLYIDLDGCIDEAIKDFQLILSRLQERGLDLNMVRLFSSGSKGFHLEIPMVCFIHQSPKAGIKGLPAIYKEMVWQAFVTDSTDFRVYSQGRGRMWRVPNRQRENGKFKVPLTVDQALNITAESYAALVSAPRPFPALAAPSFCPGLALLYSQALDKVMKARNIKRKRSPNKTSELLQARCKAVGAALPPSILALGAGLMKPREDAGFNQIAIQLCTTAHALNMGEDELVARCAGLIADHEGDGSRYGTPRKREAALREMYDYTFDNPCYEFSVGGVRSIFPASAGLNDLRGL